MFTPAMTETAEKIIGTILDFAASPVSRFTSSQDTRTAITALVNQCWNTEGMDDKATADCMAHCGMFGVPIVQIVRLNNGSSDSIPAHVLSAVCDLLINGYADFLVRRRAALAAKRAALHKQ